MRPLLYGDISAAARVLYAAPAQTRAALCQQMLAEAEDALDFARSTGRIHPVHGNGSLMAAARKRPLPPEPGFDDPDYRRCMAQVLQAIR